MFMRIVKISMNALTILGLGYMFYCIITGFISWICDCSVGGLVPLKCIIEDMYKFAPIALIASIIGILIFKNLFKLHSFRKHLFLSIAAAILFETYFYIL